MLRKVLLTFAFFLTASLCCRNPFLPPTGKPIPALGSMQRGKPSGVIDQLINSYESKRLDLYESILADSFKFYVAHSFEPVYLTKYTFDREQPDSSMQYIDKADYFYYWTKAMELQSHRKLFSDDEQTKKTIEFSPPPEIISTRYITDSEGDTVKAELLTSGGELLITLSSTYQITNYTVSIEKQVFLLEKDADDLWVIRKWYDLSSAQSLN